MTLMKILIITGKLAKSEVFKAAGSFADILVVSAPVASLITPDLLISNFKKSEFSNKKYDIGLISGFSKTDFSKAEKILGFPIMSGPKCASDLSFVKDLPLSYFSREKPVCVHLSDIKRENAFSNLIEFEEKADFSFMVGSVKVGKDSKMKIIYEIVDANRLSLYDLKNKINDGINSGADFIDLGFSPETDPKEVFETVEFSKSISSVPISSDTISPFQIFESLLAGSDIILSLTPENINELYTLICKKFDENETEILNFTKGKTFVLLPNLDLINNSYKPKLVATSLIDFYNFAKSLLPKSNFILDPVLNPPGFGISDSICAYKYLKDLNVEKIPVLFGTGNVTELIDADSIGVNSLLAAFASEVGASVLFTPQASDKTDGSVSELARASEMMFLAKNRSTFPKDLGIDLLKFKEKRKRKPVSINSVPFIESSPVQLAENLNSKFIRDKGGDFYINIVEVRDLKNLFTEIEFIDEFGKPFPENKKLILVSHSKKIYVGDDASILLENILESGFVTLLSHAAYLGSEIKKAEISIIQNRSYLQDDDF
ncbi:MAG: dihydropteroate synthase-like protein [Methanosarcinaceae archaeon]|nr:dihydropteroate synthase-like protein [Methanosarcinaceae archaeon]